MHARPDGWMKNRTKAVRFQITSMGTSDLVENTVIDSVVVRFTVASNCS